MFRQNRLAKSERSLQDVNDALQFSKRALELAEDARDAAQTELQQNDDERIEAYVYVVHISQGC